MKFGIWLFFENLSRKFNFHQNMIRITGILHEQKYVLLIIPHLVLFGMKNAAE